MEREEDKGVALTVTAGILTLLLLAGAGLFALASRVRIEAGLQIDRTTARLLAQSGIEYGAARLFEDSSPRSPSLLDAQPDDWTYRDGLTVPLERTLNPSYARTEPYTDLGGNGRYDPSVDTCSADWNQNGRFDSWSGRLRGAHAPTSSTFVLRIESELAKLYANEGYLDGADRNGNGVPDHRDLGRRLLALYSKSGYQATPCYDGGEMYWVETYLDTSITADEWMWSSLWGGGVWGEKPPLTHVVMRNRRMADLVNELGILLGLKSLAGNGIVEKRPLGGFASRETLRRAMEEGRSSPSLFPYLSLSSPGRLWLSGACPDKTGPYVTVPRTSVALNGVPEPVLQVLVQGVSYLPSPYRDDFTIEEQLPQSMRTVQPPEAQALARGIAASRPFASWYQFVEWLEKRKTDFFTGTPAQVNGKALAVEQHLNPDSLEKEAGGLDWSYRTGGAWSGGYSWQTYDLERDTEAFYGDPLYGDRRLARGGKLGTCRKVRNPPPPYDSDSSGWEAYGTWITGEVTLAPVREGSFDIESLGRVPRRSGVAMGAVLRLSGEVSARTQVDFENPAGFKRVSDGAWIGRPWKNRMQTWPSFSLEDGVDPNSIVTVEYNRGMGTVRLMDRSDGPRPFPEVFYLPSWEKDQPMRIPPVSSGIRGSFEAFQRFSAAQPPKPAAPFDYPSRKPFANVNEVNPLSSPGVCHVAGFAWGEGQGPDSSGDRFPMVPEGMDFVPRGTVEFEGVGIGRANVAGLMLIDMFQYNPIERANPYRGSFTRFIPRVVYKEWISSVATWSADLVSIRTWTYPETRFVVITFGEDGVRGFIDGIPDPGLTTPSYEPDPMPPARRSDLTLLRVDEVRLSQAETPAAAIQARAGWLRWWTPMTDSQIDEQLPQPPAFEVRARLKAIPHYVSSLYRFDRPAEITSARWDGFVPRKIVEAVDASGASAPLRVDLLCYDSLDGTGDERVIELPEEFWRTGGGTKSFKPFQVRCRSFRYRVWMDVPADGSFNIETPVFDAIQVFYKAGAKISDAWER